MQSNTLNMCIQDRLHPVVHMHRLIDLRDGEMFTEIVFPFENPVEVVYFSTYTYPPYSTSDLRQISYTIHPIY